MEAILLEPWIDIHETYKVQENEKKYGKALRQLIMLHHHHEDFVQQRTEEIFAGIRSLLEYTYSWIIHENKSYVELDMGRVQPVQTIYMEKIKHNLRGSKNFCVKIVSFLVYP